MDENYIKVNGEGMYLYRAVDKAGRTIDFYLSQHRDAAAAKAFFRKAILHHGQPKKVSLDGREASHLAVNDLKEEKVIVQTTLLRSCKYLNSKRLTDGIVKSASGTTNLCWRDMERQ